LTAQRVRRVDVYAEKASGKSTDGRESLPVKALRPRVTLITVA
jgi:hypothetical protein